MLAKTWKPKKETTVIEKFIAILFYFPVGDRRS